MGFVGLPEQNPCASNSMFRLTQMFVRLCLIVAYCLVGALSAEHVSAADQKATRLVLQITVDGLRADLLHRYRQGFGEGGFNYLFDTGAYFTNAHYQYANTETIVGHTTLATGALPSQHGMIGNVWFDREAAELAYNIEDPDHPLLPTRKEEAIGGQVDPAQKKARTRGRSPRVILAPTFSDTLSASYGGRSKIFSVSGKDRSSVSMAGQTGKAFWFSTNTGDFITSSYYYDEYPEWVMGWNSQLKAEGYQDRYWTLLNDPSSYLLFDQDNRPYEADLSGFSRTFPHPFEGLDDKLFFTKILTSPVGDQLTLDFAKEMIVSEQIGADDIPDYVSISFSGVDAVNHFFGPSSLENEDVVMQLDNTLAELFAFIDQQVGLAHTLVILSADHGMAEMPEYMTELGYQAGRLVPMEIAGTANKAAEQFGIDGVVLLFYRPYLYLDNRKIEAASADVSAVRQAITEALMKMDGIALAAAVDRLSDQHADPVWDKIRNNHHRSRSGDIYVVQKPYWFLFDDSPIKAMHGSPWRYDTHVPIIFSGPGINAQTISRLVHPADVSPTISALLGISPPASADGIVLKDLFNP